MHHSDLNELMFCMYDRISQLRSQPVRLWGGHASQLWCPYCGKVSDTNVVLRLQYHRAVEAKGLGVREKLESGRAGGREKLGVGEAGKRGATRGRAEC